MHRCQAVFDTQNICSNNTENKITNTNTETTCKEDYLF